MIIPDKGKWSRWVIGLLALAMMASLYIFQRKLWWVEENSQVNHIPYMAFILNRTIRLVLNDGLCLLLFIAIFNRKQELKLASVVFAVELLLILPLYLILKLSWEGDSEISSPLLSFIHRLIVNPLLMIILLVGLLYQKYRLGK